MENVILKQILETYRDKSNKELANILIILEDDFKNIKQSILGLTDLMRDIEITHDAVFNELQIRLKFK